jgi:hypothetical protein
MVLVTILVSSSTAQITIQQSAFSNLLTAGTSLYIHKSDSAPRPVNIGKQGGPTIYDLNGYAFQSTDISHVYSVGALPILAARYPAKAVVFGQTPETIEKNPVFLFSTDTLYVIGQASMMPQRQFMHMRPYEPMATFPVTYQAKRTYSHMHYDTTYNAAGSVVATLAFSGSDSVTVDGFGTLKILGRQFECLRVKLNHYTFSDKEFMYMTREGILLDIQMASTQRDTGVVQPESVTLLVPSALVGVEEAAQPPLDFALGQNYPNPFNPRTAISYQLLANSFVNLRVYDVLGREVATLVNENRMPGRYIVHWDASELPGGVYFCRLQARTASTSSAQSASTSSAQSFVDAKKMILAK